ncbi:MAG: molybdate ABC transporter substrate-binding protein [Chloroflexi bacterium]|nr:molybdate ABC transporter substrate-binding protein [Chloroflexota bacterium]
MTRILSRISLAFVAVLVVAGCGTASSPSAVGTQGSAAQAPREVTVFAASSLTESFTEMATVFEHDNPGTKIVFNFGSSSQLRTQLENGAQADVFASADQKQMDLAAQANVIAGKSQVFANNSLVVVVPSTNPAGIAGPADLAKPGVKLVLAGPEVPAGAYARRAITAMSQSSRFGADFEKNALSNVVSQEDNVKRVLAKVQMGEADAGFVYVSDAKGAEGVKAIPVPSEFQETAQYPIALVKEGHQPDVAAAFVRYVLGDQGQAILAKHGFVARR